MKVKSIVQIFASIALAIALFNGNHAAPSDLEQRIAEITLPRMSYSSFKRSEAKLKGLRPGDMLTTKDIGIKYFKLSKWLSSNNHIVVVGDGWISSMSGKGTYNLGRAFGVEGKTIYGRHLFGYVYGNATLVPKYQLLTKATILPDTDYQELNKNDGEKGIRRVIFNQKGEKYYFNDNEVTIVSLKHLPFQAIPEMTNDRLPVQEVEIGNIFDFKRSISTKASFEDTEIKLKNFQPGIDSWDMIHHLNGTFVTKDFGHEYIIFMKGYANYEGDKRWQLATEHDVYEVWPFGYVEDDKEVLKLSVIFRNGKLQKIMPYETQDSLITRLQEQP